MSFLKSITCLYVFLISASVLSAQQYLNLDFEKSTPAKNAVGWSQRGTEYEVKVDTMIFHSGKKSLRIVKLSEGGFGLGVTTFPINDAKGKHLHYTGWIKTEGITNGYAGLWWRVDGKDKSKKQGFDNMSGRGPSGTTPWTKYSIEMDIDTAIININFGVLMPGDGKAWFDDLQIELDGKIYEQKQNEFDEGSNIKFDGIDKEKAEDLTLLGKLWGFLKYYHPNIATGKYNWDYELFRIIPKVINCNSKNEINMLELEWIKSIGEIKEFEDHKAIDTANVKIFPDLDWITKNSQFDEEIIKQLNQIKNVKRNNENYYVDLFPLGNPNFKNEQSYENISYLDAGYRLLTLFRYWNIIQYFYPYRYLIEKEWDDVLSEFIPKFINVKSELDYKLTIQALIAKVHDTHANIWNDKTLIKYFGSNNSPLEIKFIENKAVVVDYFNDELGKKTKLLKGDIILSVNNKKIDDILKERLPILPASNYKAQLKSFSNILLRSNNNKNKIEYERDGKIYEDSVNCYDPRSVNLFKKYLHKDTCWKFITKEIGYIYPGTIKSSYLPLIMSELKDTKGIIIDLRCYPSDFIVFTLGKYLMNKEIDFVKLTKGEIKSPGLFTFMKNEKIGGDNPNYYKGKVIILIDESTLSQAEYTTMAFRVAPHAIVIGSTTAAADGNVSAFYLPCGIRTQITGLGVYYPDRKETQQVGIIPDIYIEPTIRGVKEGRDELIEKAIELINNDMK